MNTTAMGRSRRRALATMSTVAAIVLGTIAALVANTLPVFLAVMSRVLQLSESQSGLLAFADMGGIAVGTIACAFFPAVVHRLSWRGTAAAGLILLALANVSASQVSGFAWLLASRLLAGVGSGVVMAVTYASLAGGSGARALAIFNFVQLGSGWLGMPLLAPLAEHRGPQVLFGLIALLALGSLLLCPFLPVGRQGIEPGFVGVPEKVSPVGWTAISAALLFFTSVGAVYAYLAFMGVAWGGIPAHVEADLSTMMFAGMLGGLTVAILGARLGYRRPLYVSYVFLLVSLAMLAALRPVQLFLPLICIFAFSWNVLTPYQFEAVTRVDRSSSAAMLVNATCLGGLAIGPAFAGYLVSADFLRVNVSSWCACGLSLLLLLVALKASDRQRRGLR
jgi:predicted MFS family arabinose efflux permease